MPFVTNMGNPSAEYCLARGGSYDGTDGICRLPDGSATEAWSLFRSDPQASEIATAYREARARAASGSPPAQAPGSDPSFGRNMALVVFASLAVGAVVYYAEKK
jgi:hypothetical protein